MKPKQVDIIGRWAFTLCVAAFILLLVQRGVRPFLRARADLGSFREAARILTDAQGTLNQLHGDVSRLSQEIRASEARLPRDADLDRFLERLEVSARETRVHVELLTPQEISDHGLFREQQVDVRVTGSFPHIYRLLDRLEESDQLSRVEQLRIAGGESGGPCAADVRLALYCAPQGRE
ncbi:MAG: type 4a pilus biogenesis protein PilO [Candidatus Eisenbacteria bacterium]